jgi:hypothetical protein
VAVRELGWCGRQDDLSTPWARRDRGRTRYHDLGSDFFDKGINPERRKRAHIHQFEALGYKFD